MAAKPTPKAVTDAILIDWRIGQLSQHDIAEKHRVSKGLVNKICKGVEQDAKAIVTAGVQYQQALSDHDDRIVTAVQNAVNEIVRVQKFFRGANMLIAKKVYDKVQSDGTNASFQELNAAAAALGRAQTAVLGKSPETAINNTNAVPVVSCSPEELRRINQALEDAC